MKELIRHIEALLLENDCVILPNFGGFITHHSPAQWIDNENIFLPPFRSIGFNSQLKINDGLLVQSYMQTHDAAYPEATRLVDAAIDELTEILYKEGSIEFHGIGILRRTIVGEYDFTPMENGVITPSLYGFSSLDILPLNQLKKTAPITCDLIITGPSQDISENDSELKKQEVVTAPVHEEQDSKLTAKQNSKILTIKIRKEWLSNAVSIAAAILLFFALSTPADNTYIEEENYASLGSINVFEQIRKQSAVTTLLTTSNKSAEEPDYKLDVDKEESTPVTTVANVTKEETSKSNTKIALSEKEETPSLKKRETALPVKEIKAVMPAEKKQDTPNISYNVIVASVASAKDAEQVIRNLAAKGHTGAFSISGSGRFRIAISSFSNQADAYRKVNELKQAEIFKDAWVLTDRK